MKAERGYGGMAKWVYCFGGGKAEGSAHAPELLGGKGACLAQMCKLKLPVPPGFTITTEAWAWYCSHENSYPEGLRGEVCAALAETGRLAGRHFGSTIHPLLLSVRSGARVSMPGMMDTVLNLGLNDATVRAIASEMGAGFAYDSYRRFIQMYCDVVLGLDCSVFEDILDAAKARRGYNADSEMTADDWKDIVVRYKACVAEEPGQSFPQDPEEQLWGAVGAVFASWMTPRAMMYRRLQSIPEDWGTAVNVQAMVFGNMGNDSATGVAFTRNPSTGEHGLCGEFLVNAQGEDIVAGIRTPQDITESARIHSGSGKLSLERLMPAAFADLQAIAATLEMHYRDVHDLEFTIERGRVWMLQTRKATCTAHAALKIAVEMAEAGLISKEEAVMRIEPALLGQLLHPVLDPQSVRVVIAVGLPASSGVATGEIVFSADEAVAAAAEGRKVILVRAETSPKDIYGMNAAQAVLTTRGGITSHAAVIARGMGKPCVSGAGSVCVIYDDGVMTADGKTFKKGDVITIDGDKGEVMAGEVRLLQPELSGDFVRIMQWSDNIRCMKVRANAETPAEARLARTFGAEGIGLCRTEHMFSDSTCMTAIREVALSGDEPGRRCVLAKLLSVQRAGFIELFEIMKGLPVTIRLFDLPFQEFLHETGMLQDLECRRLAINFPEIVEMQVRAIFEAAIKIAHRAGVTVMPEIMVPGVRNKAELDCVKACIDAVARDVMKETEGRIAYQVGTMIESRREGVIPVEEFAWTADFFLFESHNSAHMALVCNEGRIQKNLKFGVCCESGEESAAISFCKQTGVDYISCAPLRIPIVRLAAAQAMLNMPFSRETGSVNYKNGQQNRSVQKVADDNSDV